MDPRVGVEWALGAGSKRWGKDLSVGRAAFLWRLFRRIYFPAFSSF